MKIYFVSGFLGSGKTTSIINSAKLLMKDGQKTGVVTNDQGKYLVDNHFVNASGIPSVEVSEGCFCCNYDDFDSHILKLAHDEQPDVIFAESVGSCADIVATVMKPLSDFRKNHSIRSVLSTVTDARLLRARFSGRQLPFSSDVIYIFDKQIEEADILIINKTDLLLDEETEQLIKECEQRYPEKIILAQSAFSEENLSLWLRKMDRLAVQTHEGASMEMDYDRYTDGELRMGWVDKVFRLESADTDIGPALKEFLRTVHARLAGESAGIGHLKLFVRPEHYPAYKISLTGMDTAVPHGSIPEKSGTSAEIILNARVEAEPSFIRQLINEVLDSITVLYDLKSESENESFFRPGKPAPVHRYI